ncbi:MULTISPECIES: ArsR/SmtB family transcription factor [Roseovarius]|uniref:Helix-turn-helix transcriptional regulator n=2 Tax=Roseovarius TaxID=74030 RepID=A0ABZ2HCE3_9RHOB|nr:helix-turn-helix transcriptional regulator [Roseovarius sp. W115]MDV2928378.1 helix-turn-helix transcriptional regulator [Roseovarius sp. W115]
MDTSTALSALQALSHETRLEVFRLLMRAGPEGLAAGDIATTCGVRQNTMSSHLSILTQAGLIVSERDGRTILYRANVGGIQNLLGFLIEDCCGGNPAECQPLIQQLACPC